MPYVKSMVHRQLDFSDKQATSQFIQKLSQDLDNAAALSRAANLTRAASATPVLGGASITLKPNLGSLIVPHRVQYVTTGTPNLTVNIKATYNDGSTVTLSKAITTAGTVFATDADIVTLYKDGLYIVKFDISATGTGNNPVVTLYGTEA